MELQKKEGLHQGWIVFIGSILIIAFGMGLMMNCRGVIFSAVISDLGFRSGDLSVYYTIQTLACALSVGLTSKFYLEKNSKLVMLVLIGLVCTTTGLMGFYNHLWQWYISAIFNGIGGGSVMMVIGITLNNWFRLYNGTVVGIAMASSGVSGAIFNPICSKLIMTMGWRKTVIIIAAIGLSISVVAIIFMLESSPEKVGKKPFGEGAQGSARPVSGKEAKEFFTPKYIFPFTTLALVLFMAISPINNQLAVYSTGLGYSLTVGAAVTSCSMIGNVVGKVSLGALTDKLGIYRAVNIIQVIVLISLVLFLVGKSNQYFLYAAALLYGTIFSVSTTMPPLLFLDLYGVKEYRSRVSTNQMLYGIIMALLSSALPYIYDFTGTYDVVFIAGIVCSVASMVMFNSLCKFSQKRKNEQVIV